MARDVNVKKLKKNAFRQSKVRGETASRVRCPGGEIDVESLQRVVDIATKYGKGMVNITNRQGFEIPGIDIADMEEVNKALQLIIENRGINQEEYNGGYPASGTRNVVACPGKSLCPFGCYDTKAFAQEVDKAIFPNDHHVKIAFTGCSNDCAHTRLNDFGIIGQTEPQYDPTRCIGCGVCVNYCPTRAWTRSKEEYFRLVLLGRTGKKNPRMAEDFMKWADHDTVLKIICNVYAYLDEYLDKEAVESKEHIGYIVDRTGFEEFLKYIRKDVQPNPKCEIQGRIYWGGKRYDQTNELRQSMFRFSEREE